MSNNCSCSVLRESELYFSVEKLNDTMGEFPGFANQFMLDKIDEMIKYMDEKYKIEVSPDSVINITKLYYDYIGKFNWPRIYLKGREYFYSPEAYSVVLAHEIYHAKRLHGVLVDNSGLHPIKLQELLIEMQGDTFSKYTTRLEEERDADESITGALDYFKIPYNKSDIDNMVAVRKNRLEIYKLGGFESEEDYQKFLKTIVFISTDIKSSIERQVLYEEAERKFALLDSTDKSKLINNYKKNGVSGYEELDLLKCGCSVGCECNLSPLSGIVLHPATSVLVGGFSGFPTGDIVFPHGASLIYEARVSVMGNRSFDVHAVNIRDRPILIRPSGSTPVQVPTINDEGIEEVQIVEILTYEEEEIDFGYDDGE